MEGASAVLSRSCASAAGFPRADQRQQIEHDLGYSHPIDYTVPAGVKVAVDQKQTTLVVSGADKELVGQVAAEV